MIQPPAIDPRLLRPATEPLGPARAVGPDELPLLASKLSVPDPPPGMVDRPRLAELLATGTQGPVTTLAAPAGWGKTVLLSSWLAGGGAPRPAVWLTLEAGDDGPRFWSYVHAALAAELPGPPPPATPDPADPAYLPRLAAAVAAMQQPVMLVLDDFHLVSDPAVPRGLEFLLRHSNGRFRLVVATRSEPALPLHRWRLSGELTEVRAADLAFTEAEAAELLARQGLRVPGRVIRAVHARAEGWAAGIRLAALALRADPDPARVVTEFTGDQPAVAEYLTAELLAPLAPDARDVLLRTAVLDRFCAESADAVTGRSDGERLLGAVAAEANGFVVPVTGQPGWYRCHRLVGDLLRAELGRQRPDGIDELHRRAARWHADHGFPAAAVRHTLAARDFPTATRLLAAHWPQVALCGHDETRRVPLPPAPPETLAGEPLLALAYATDRLDAADPDGAAALLRHADPHDGDDRAALAAGRVAWAQAAGELDEVLRGARELLAHTPDGDGVPSARGRVVALAALGGARLSLGDFAAAQAALTDGAAIAAGAGFGCGERRCTALLALLHAVRGQLRAAQTAARAALAVPACRGRRCPRHAAGAHLALAVVEHERDRPAEADRQLDAAATLAGEPLLATALAIVRAGRLQADGEPGRALEVLLAARRTPDGERRGRHLDHWLCATEADLRTAHGDPGRARDLLTGALAHPAERTDALAVALARAHLRAGDPGAALAALPPRPPTPDGAQPLAVRLDAALVEAVAARALGEQRRAHQILEHALELAAPDGHRRIFTQGPPVLRTLLAEHLDSGTAHRSTITELVDATDPRQDEGPRDAPAEPLTDRELTILRYLQSTLSNGEIAAELFLSVNTVKTHVRNIYQKLGAPRRREAVRRARELRLL